MSCWSPCGVLILALGLGMSARAEEITFAFSATLDQVVPGSLPASVTEDDLMSGRFTFDSEAAEMSGGPGTEAYLAVCRVEVTVEGLVFEGAQDPLGNPGGITVRDEGAGAERDGYTVGFSPMGDISNFVLNLLALPGTNAIATTALPVVPPDLTPFATGTRTLAVNLGDPYQAFLGVGDAENFTEFSLAEEALPCPEPQGGTSIAAVLGALGGIAARRRSRATSRWL